MDGKHLSFCHKWFEDYAGRVHCPDAENEKNIILKLMHTYRVCENITKIARSLGMKEDDLALAQALAIFHDVGRFEQLRDFGSFNDGETVDHAKLGLKVINRSGVLSCLPKRERNIIRKSIWHHNKYQIPITEKADVTLFSRLIRDADKLDILGIVALHFETRDRHPNQALDFGLTDELEISPEVVSDILQGKMVRIAALKTLGDMRLMYSSWIFDINFPATIACIKEKGYLKRLLAGLPIEPEIILVRDFLQAYLEKRSRMSI
ncbi:MAG: HD domain-containing protein [Methanothrix sp.]|nr:HD domain-containing protein [Methanothrix sp.]